MFNSAVNAWRNASLDSAKYSVEIEIGDRSNWLLPAIFPRIGKWWNDCFTRPAKTVGGLVFETKAKEPPPMPELPEAFQGNSMGEGLKKAYEQRCNKVIASAKSTQCMLNLDFTGMRQQEAISVHEQAMDRIALPENERPNAPVSSADGTLIGGLVANTPIANKVKAAIG